MSTDTRQQRRKLVRERLKIGQQGFARGLVERPKRPDMVGVAEVLRSKLCETGNPHRASEAAGLAHALAERSLRTHPPKRDIACRKGCHYCCHGFVGASAPEVFRLADAVRRAGGRALAPEAVRARTIPLKDLTPDQRIGRKLPCPLLVDGMCGVYAARPLVCRQATSLSLPACIEEFEGIEIDGGIEISSVHLAHSGNAHLALLAALRATGLPMEAYELGSALDIALADPDSERKWLDGEPVFAALTNTVRRERDGEVLIAHIAGELSG